MTVEKYLLAGMAGSEIDRIGIAAAEAGHDLFRYDDRLQHAPREAIAHAYGSAATQALKAISQAHNLTLEELEDATFEPSASGNFLIAKVLTTDGRTLSAMGMVPDPREVH